MKRLEEIFGNEKADLEEAKVLLEVLMPTQEPVNDTYLMRACVKGITDVRERHPGPHRFGGINRVLIHLGEHGYIEISGEDDKRYYMGQKANNFFRENYMRV